MDIPWALSLTEEASLEETKRYHMWGDDFLVWYSLLS